MTHPFFWTVIGAHFAVAGLALLIGKPPERWAAGNILLALLLEWAVVFALRVEDIKPSHYAATIDIGINFIISFGFLGIAMRYPQGWIIAAMLIQSGELALDALFFVDDEGRQVLASPTAYNILSLGILALVAIATMASAIPRKVRAGPLRRPTDPIRISAAGMEPSVGG